MMSEKSSDFGDFLRGGAYQIRQKYLKKYSKIYHKYLHPKLIRYVMYTLLQINRSQHAFLTRRAVPGGSLPL